MLLESKADVNIRNMGSSTPLHAAAQSDQVECGRILIKYGADVTALNLGGATPQESASKTFCVYEFVFSMFFLFDLNRG